MMTSEMAVSGMRVLSDTEIALVAGGPDQTEINEAGVNDLVNRDTMLYRTPDGIFVETYVTVGNTSAWATAYDSDRNGLYDVIWFQTSGGWLCSFNGATFNACSSPAPLIDSYLDENFPEQNEVQG